MSHTLYILFLLMYAPNPPHNVLLRILIYSYFIGISNYIILSTLVIILFCLTGCVVLLYKSIIPVLPKGPSEARFKPLAPIRSIAFIGRYLITFKGGALKNIILTLN